MAKSYLVSRKGDRRRFPGAVSGNADKYLPSFVQKSAVSFLQLSVGSKNPSQARVAEFLREKGSAINSRVLSALAVRVAEDPFVKVKKMIKDLIVRLMEEANEEAEHKGWCDTELSTNEQTRKEKTAAVETLQGELERASGVGMHIGCLPPLLALRWRQAGQARAAGADS